MHESTSFKTALLAQEYIAKKFYTREHPLNSKSMNF